MGIRHFVTILASCCVLVLLAGCTPEQVAQGDRGITDANSLAAALRDLAAGPAGALLPAPVRTVLEVLGIAGALAVVVWQQLRGRLLRVTAASIVQAVEALPVDQKQAVKAAVRTEMKDREIYSRANAVVDQLKAVM